MGMFDDLIPKQPAAPKRGMFDDLIPAPVEAPPAAPTAADTATYLGQRMSRGATADVLGAPVDLATMGVNAGMSIIDWLANTLGAPEAVTNITANRSKPGGFMSSDWIADKAASAYEGMGGTVVPPEDVSPLTRTVGEGARFAAAAMVPSTILASTARTGQAPTSVGRAINRAVTPTAPREVVATTPLRNPATGIVDAYAAPYTGSAAKQVAGDIAAGFGSGMTMQGYQDIIPDGVKETLGAFGPIAAALIGGVGGSTAMSAARGGGKAAWQTLSKPFRGADPNAPINPATGQPFTAADMDMAAQITQQQPTNISQAVDNIETGKREFSQFANPSETPTTGMLADDIGLAMQENTARARDPQRFAERDVARRALASDKVASSAPVGAEGTDFTGKATDLYDETLNTARKQVDDAKTRQTAGQRGVDQQAAEIGEYRTRQGEASTRLSQEFDQQYLDARAEKNRLYGAMEDGATVDGESLANDLAAIEARVPRAAQTGSDYATMNSRIRGLLEGTDEAGNAIVNDLTYGDLRILRADVSAMRKEAVAAGKDVTYLDQIGQVLSDRINEMNPEAAANYNQNYAPRFRTGKAGEYTDQLKRAAKTGEESSATRPSEFGDKFLRKPEDAAALNRAIGVNGNPVTAENARDWMLGDLAKSNVLTGSAEVRYDRFKAWADKNKAVIDQFPEVRQRVDAELERARLGGRLSTKLAEDVKNAESNLKTTESDLRRSALQSAIGNSPENAVGSIMGSGDPAKRLAEMVGHLKGDQKATDGLKAAIRDWIRKKVGTTARNVGDPESEKFSRAGFEKLFKEHEKTLAEIYTPEEMNALRQAQKLLGAEANLDVRTTAGSNTYDKFMAAEKGVVAGRKRMLEAALKAKFGVLKGGGVFRTINILLDTLPNSTKAVEDILFEMQFNPDLAVHLLTRPVKEVGTPAWNAKLNRLLAVAAGAREGYDVESSENNRKPLEIEVRPKRSN